MQPPEKTREDAIAIFKAGVDAVAPQTAVTRFCARQDETLVIGTHTFDLQAYERIYVVGAGKATAPMAAAIEDLIGDYLTSGVITVKYEHTVPLQNIL